MLNFSIHTFELRLELTAYEICAVRDWLYSKGVSIKKYESGDLNILEYSKQGVRIRFIPDHFKPYLAFIVNLQKVIENDNLVDLISFDNAERAI